LLLNDFEGFWGENRGMFTTDLKSNRSALFGSIQRFTVYSSALFGFGLNKNMITMNRIKIR